MEAASASQGMWAPVVLLCRRNGKVGLSGMAIADITLLSGFSALRADLEKVWSASWGQWGVVKALCAREPALSLILAAEPCLVQGSGLPPSDHLSFPTADLPL